MTESIVDQSVLKHYGSLIGRLSGLLTRKKRLFATAESCTGGLIAALCTGVPGSSAWFSGGVVAYANELKQRLLHVPPELLDTYGAVSEPVARHMALGALASCGAQAAVGVTGIAGPDGGTPEKPVGTVWIACAVAERPPGNSLCVSDAPTGCVMPLHTPGTDSVLSCEDGRGTLPVTVTAECRWFPGSRAEVRFAAVEAAFTGMVQILEAAG